MKTPIVPRQGRRPRRHVILSGLLLTGIVAGSPSAAAETTTSRPAVQRDRVTFRSEGTEIVGYRYRSSSAASRPVVVMAPGFGALQSGHLRPYAHAFAAAGYDTLTFDYRSWGESAGAARNVLDIQAELADWRAAISAARRLPDVDPERIVLWGSSLAGGHVLQTAVTEQRLAAVIAQVPHVDGLITVTSPGRPLAVTAGLVGLAVQDVLGAATGRPPIYIPIVAAPGQPAAITTPGAHEAYTADPAPGWTNQVAARVILQMPLYSPKNDAPRSTAPTFIGVTDADNLTPPGPATALAQQMNAETHTYRGGHFDVYQGGSAFPHILADELAFLRKHVKPATVLGRVRSPLEMSPS